MGGAHVHPDPFSCVGPSALNPHTGEYECVWPFVIDDGQFEGEKKGGGLDGLP